ncbi:MAG: dihydrofolate reductase family protein [Kineosporiaceae bacterium]|nr:dihydrofolate reductase family protein [Kineosporiaceae bacterium]
MGSLVYLAIASLDGYVEDDAGDFGWAAPDEEVHAFVNDLERDVTTYLYGRRMYQTMAAWEDLGTGPDASPIERDFGQIWRAADKIVFSRTLTTTSTARTRLEPEFSREVVAALKLTIESDLGIGGAELAAQALQLDLVDEVILLLQPVTVGAGKPALPPGVRLRLLDQRRFTGGAVLLHYAVRR